MLSLPGMCKRTVPFDRKRETAEGFVKREPWEARRLRDRGGPSWARDGRGSMVLTGESELKARTADDEGEVSEARVKQA